MIPTYTPTPEELGVVKTLDFGRLETLTEQETPRAKWLKQRQGKFTASNIHKLLTYPEKNELPKGAISYIEEVALEILTNGQSRNDFTSEAMAHGTETELLAVQRFEQEAEVFCYNTGQEQEFIQYNDYFGGTPDGLIGDDLLVEIKCPNPKTHFFNINNLKTAEDLKKHYPAYYWQIQANLFITGRKVGVFVSFDNRFVDEEKQFVMVEVPFHREDCEFMLSRLKMAIDKLNKLVNC